MADIFDDASLREQQFTDSSINRVREQAKLDPGLPGECELCGEDSPRLIRGACAPCRDKRKLP